MAGIPVIVSKVVFDHLILIAKAKHKVFVSVMSINLHKVPKDWPITDPYLGLGRNSVSSRKRVPSLPQKITTFTNIRKRSR